MKRSIRSLTAIGVVLTVNAPIATPAHAYQVDCAILLCLAGGFPASVPCTHARTVFIRRITPWPIEPPLQIWNCPMGVSLNGSVPLSPMQRLYDIAFRSEPGISVPVEPMPLVQIQDGERADIDISGDAFDFVRSIRVYHIQFSQRENNDGSCTADDTTRVGTYGIQGDYRWTHSSVAEIPLASALPTTGHCIWMSYRSVFVDWRDHEGNYGFEEVRY